MGPVPSAVLYTLTAFVFVWPLTVLAERPRERAWVLVASCVGALIGAVFVFLPASGRLPVESILLKGGTLWTGLCLLLAVLDVSGLGALRRRHHAAHLGLILGLSVTALPLSAVALVRDVRAEVFLKESQLPWASAAAVALVTAGVCWLASQLLARCEARRYVTLWGYLLVAPVVRIAIQPSVGSNVEVIISRVAHDWMHVLVILFQVPDHVYLSDAVWSVIGFVFMKTTGMLMNLAVFIGIVLFVIVRQAAIPLPLKEDETPPDRRRRWARLKVQRRIAFAPVLVATVLFGWLTYAGWASQGTPKTPVPTPLPRAGIEVASLADREVHSFTFGEAGDKRVIAILKPDGSYAVCLDACLICPPDGYAQLGADLFCLYCGTPIPIDTVGQPGGCNPIPLMFEHRGARLVFDTASAEQTWKEANVNK
jgi:uncharacterized membrane protein